ncbi:MAG: sel1 repeat family protein [Alphaproteobacteria bacterium]|nr:sel1 repeat family protein [Alphaproteobacteria bacterium]
MMCTKGVGARLAVVVFALSTWSALPAHAAGESFIDGLAAYDAGDVAETVRIWRALAEAGDINAQVGLAGLHLAGSGVPHDPAKAARLYRLAAEQGDSNGQLNLGRLYLDGVGVERDPAAAYAWLSLAARQGRRWAKEQSLAIEPTLSKAQRVEAEALVTDIESR